MLVELTMQLGEGEKVLLGERVQLGGSGKTRGRIRGMVGAWRGCKDARPLAVSERRLGGKTADLKKNIDFS